MAATRKTVKRRSTAQRDNGVRPVRLELAGADHARLERCARERGLNKASYARQAVLERIKLDEAAVAGGR
ncbi:MAG: hypothetical protein ACLQVF_40885 [Isosphaeraceae bacterium]